MENINVSENVVAGEGVYQPGTLKALCLRKVESSFPLCQFSQKDLPMSIIGELYETRKQRKHIEYIHSLMYEFNSHNFGATPCKFSSNLFDAIIYPEENTSCFNIEHLIVPNWPDDWRITLRYGMTRNVLLTRYAILHIL